MDGDTMVLQSLRAGELPLACWTQDFVSGTMECTFAEMDVEFSKGGESSVARNTIWLPERCWFVEEISNLCEGQLKSHVWWRGCGRRGFTEFRRF
jgi:hypothetical protein